VPFRGSVAVLGAATSLFLLFALALGLFISDAGDAASFVAAQIAFLTTMLPLSAHAVDIASMPAWLQAADLVFPVRYLGVDLQTLFLAGTDLRVAAWLPAEPRGPRPCRRGGHGEPGG